MVIPARAVHGGGALDTPELLIRRAGNGDEQAFAELYDIVAGPVLGIVSRVVRDHAEAEEVARNVLLEMWQKAPQFDEQQQRVLAWAMTIAHRRAVDQVRAAAAGAEQAGQSELRWCFDEVVQTTLDHIDDPAVRGSLAELTDLQCRSLILAYYGGFTDREVSEALDKPVETVEARMRDGLIRLHHSAGMQS